MRRDHEDPPVPPPPGADPLLQHHREEQRHRQARVAKLLVALFLVVVFIVFIIQNSTRTRIDYVFFHRDTRLIWIMLACGILGGIVGFLVGRPGKQVRFRRGGKDKGQAGSTKS
jgi:uncharacterized integral membrane protein